ncbi:MAG TPA: hypothetical protein VG796_31235 [Verrucomicrobiales bacterium]|nr:hypothetical protein [Verrucomicrobiales bacterium]
MSDTKSDRVHLLTNVSRAYWCNPKEGRFQFEPADLSINYTGKHTTWLDELLGGEGIAIPTQSNGRSFSLLVSGTPGAGKSPLVIEICWRWCVQPQEGWGQLLEREGALPRILYITTEYNAALMIQNVRSLGWDRSPFGRDKRKQEEIFLKCPDGKGPIESGVLEIRTAQDLMSRILDLKSQKEKSVFALELLRNSGSGNLPQADVIVFDSLNILPANPPEDLNMAYDWLIRLGAKIVIFVADSNRQQGANQPRTNAVTETWDFACDMVLQLDRKYDSTGYIGYMIRQFEVVKARYQEHAWGKHQLKIQKGVKTDELEEEKKEMDRLLKLVGDATGPGKDRKKAAEDLQNLQSKRTRQHPYRERGGIVIFPSLHFISSRYKHESERHHGRGNEIASGICGNLTALLGKGYPEGRCTALIGCRGGHKSHLAFEEVMHRLTSQKNSSALIVSLRDDEGMTRATMTSILAGFLQQRNLKLTSQRAFNKASVEMQKLERVEGRLDLSFFPPGYITPEEFFHRLSLAIKRLRSGNPDRSITLVFNSVEQLSYRFPLCTKEPIFIPSIVQMLSAEGVSSFFIAAAPDPSHGHGDTYGLETVAELMLRFESGRAELNDFTAGLKKLKVGSATLTQQGWFPRQVAKISVDRYAGGKAAGYWGLIDLCDEETHPLVLAGVAHLHRLFYLPVG